MHHLGRVVLFGSTILLVAACAKKEQSEADTAAAVAPAPAPAPALALADVAGKWHLVSVPLAGKDTSPTNSEIAATADSTGWTLTLPDKQVVALHVSVSGDSIMARSDEFKSQRRKNAKVWSESTLRMQDGKLVGTTIAHYPNAGADSTLQLRSEGTKMP